MDANRGEAERCLREANKWLRQNRPVKALKFAKKSHSLFPTQAAQQKIAEITDLLQQRHHNPSNNNLNNGNHSNPSHQNAPQNQDFVEIDPNALNRNDSSSSFLQNMLSIEYWTLLMETVFGQCFGSIHRSLSPILPLPLLNFNLHHRGLVWCLLSIVILLLFTRFIIIGHPFGVDSDIHTYRYHNEKQNINIPNNEYRHKSKYQQQKEKYERKYNKPQKNDRSRNNDRYYGSGNDDRYYDNTYHRSRSRYHTNYGNSNYSSYFSGGNLMALFVIGAMIMGMFGNRNREHGNNNNGFNWNMLALPMLFGGFHGRFGGRRRGFGGMFGRRRRGFF